jgi:hypothetical protein
MMRTRQSYDYIIEKIGSTFYARAAPNSGLAAVTPNTDPTSVIQAAVNALTAGGSIYLKAAIYNLTATITLPYGLSFYFYGDGTPSLPYGFGNAVVTPSDGTQIRGPTSFNSSVSNISLFQRNSGAHAQGTLAFYNMAIMPAWGTPVAIVYGIYDAYSADTLRDGVMFFPWGWIEAGGPNPGYSHKIYGDTVNLTVGSGTDIRVEKIWCFGLGVGASYASNDSVAVQNATLLTCNIGLFLGGTTSNYVNTVTAEDIKTNTIQFQQGENNRVHCLFVENFPSEQTSPIYVDANTYVMVDNVYIWGNSSACIVTSITNNDAQLLGTCIGYNVGGTGLFQTFPLNKLLSTPFGGTIASPFNNTSNTIGSGGVAATPTSGTTYTVNEPIDVTITAGTGQTITTKDAAGNTIDSAVATLSHRLLLSNYAITVTFSVLGSTTVVQATVGASGTTATSIKNVNYVVNGFPIFVTSSGGTGVSISTLDGSSNTGGNTMDSGLTAMTRYELEPGQILNLGNFSAGPTITILRK